MISTIFRLQKGLWKLSSTIFSAWILLDMMIWSEFETIDGSIKEEYDVIIGR
jgi:hypothetical protein